MLHTSVEGLKFRQSLIEEIETQRIKEKNSQIRKNQEQKLNKEKGKLPNISILNNNLELSISQISQSRLYSKAQISLMGLQKKEQFRDEVKKDMDLIPSDNKYLNATFDKMTEQIILGKSKKDKNLAQINQRMTKLQQTLKKVNDYLIQNNYKSIPVYRTITSDLPNLSLIMEEEELVDRMAAITAIEERIQRMKDRHLKTEQIHSDIQKQVLSKVISQNSKLNYKMIIPPAEHLIEKQNYHLYQSRQHIQVRLNEEDRLRKYQKNKYEVLNFQIIKQHFWNSGENKIPEPYQHSSRYLSKHGSQ